MARSMKDNGTTTKNMEKANTSMPMGTSIKDTFRMIKGVDVAFIARQYLAKSMKVNGSMIAITVMEPFMTVISRAIENLFSKMAPNAITSKSTWSLTIQIGLEKPQKPPALTSNHKIIQVL